MSANSKFRVFLNGLMPTFFPLNPEPVNNQPERYSAGAANDGYVPPTRQSALLNGKLVSHENGLVPIPSEKRKDFAVMQTGDGFVLLVSKEANGTGRMIDLHRRLVMELGLKASTELTVSATKSEDIDQLYRAFLKSPQVTSAKTDYTGPEKLIEEIILAASSVNTSDIHIESRVNAAGVYFRVNGLRQIHKTLTHDEALSVGQVMYGVYADAASKDVTWSAYDVFDGSLEWTTKKGVSYQLRFSSSPIHPSGGFQIVLRVLHLSSFGLKLQDVGYTDKQYDAIEESTSSRSGMVLVCGATNSGKSTSMQAIIRNVLSVRGAGIKVITVEDPVEYVIPNACQIPVSRRRNTNGDETSSFNKALRGTLRQDPDVVMVGEIRDEASADVVKDLVLAGRKLITTLHTGSAIAAFSRLNQIGVDMDILCLPTFISSIVYQSLIPTLCQSCCVRWEDADLSVYPHTFVKRISSVADTHLLKLNGPGCEQCNGSGIGGRLVCAEVIVPDRDFLSYILEGNVIKAEEHWIKNGGVPIIEHAKAAMLKGIVSPTDVESNIYNFVVP